MQLTSEQVKDYEEKGFLFLSGHFSAKEVEVLKAHLETEFSDDSERKVNERDGDAIRSVYGSHAKNRIFQCLARHPRIVQPAMQLLSDEVYVYQFKINAKLAFRGDLWEWHQDYVFWLEEDGLPAPRDPRATAERRTGTRNVYDPIIDDDVERNFDREA